MRLAGVSTRLSSSTSASASKHLNVTHFSSTHSYYSQVSPPSLKQKLSVHCRDFITKSTAKLGKKWMEYQGVNNWDGLLDPLDDRLRSEILRYGLFVEAAYRSFQLRPFFTILRHLQILEKLTPRSVGNRTDRLSNDKAFACNLWAPVATLVRQGSELGVHPVQLDRLCGGLPGSRGDCQVRPPGRGDCIQRHRYLLGVGRESTRHVNLFAWKTLRLRESRWWRAHGGEWIFEPVYFSDHHVS
ncbi:hypothetical protein OIU77_010052 [Salix suchowensis]|uniref:Uncharacterized protein n=1 Tax=Salix suchowensis TaxID=1278906 RepID=A0ABQ9A7P7_9ROSI|nr:hypothetical protein OIU77_010052 [Salix suchowensis]